MSWWSAAGADLLEKNLAEIQNLRQRLEDSVCINDRLQERLEHALSNLDQGQSRKAPTPRLSPRVGSLKGQTGLQLSGTLVCTTPLFLTISPSGKQAQLSPPYK